MKSFLVALTLMAAIALGAVAGSASATVPDEEYPALYPGWNLLSGSGETIEQFAVREECVMAIWDWDEGGGFWRAWFRSGQGVPGGNDLSGVLDPHEAYWFYCAP